MRGCFPLPSCTHWLNQKPKEMETPFFFFFRSWNYVRFPQAAEKGGGEVFRIEKSKKVDQKEVLGGMVKGNFGTRVCFLL